MDDTETAQLPFEQKTIQVPKEVQEAVVKLTTHQIAAVIGQWAKEYYGLTIKDWYSVERDDKGEWTLTVTRDA